MNFRNWHRIVRQTLPILFVTVFISISAGIFIEDNILVVQKYPVLILLIPAFVGGCGSITTVFASKLTSAFYFEGAAFIHKRKTIFSKGLPIFFSAITFFVFLILLSIGMESAMGVALPPIAPFVISVLASAVLTVLIGMLISVGVAWITYRQHLDPDNFEAPILSTFSDVFGVVVFLSISGVLLGG